MQEWTIDLTGEMSPIKRLSFWEAKRVFFVTPQVLEKDIESGEPLEMISLTILYSNGWILKALMVMLVRNYMFTVIVTCPLV